MAKRLDEIRKRYARDVCAVAGVRSSALLAAFETVPREAFLGPGPWRVAGPGRYAPTASDDPALVYVDALVALDAAQGVNNGVPSAHAMWLAALDPKPGHRIVQIGAGTGYYTAILAELVGPAGRVDAYEIDPALAARARAALAKRANVTVHERSGAEPPLPEADRIYVNAGATAPLAAWLDALSLGGRLLFPLTDGAGKGAMLQVTRAEGAAWPARVISGAAFIGLMGGRVESEAEALEEAMRRGGVEQVRWLIRDDAQGRDDWLRGDGWRLSLSDSRDPTT